MALIQCVHKDLHDAFPELAIGVNLSVNSRLIIPLSLEAQTLTVDPPSNTLYDTGSNPTVIPVRQQTLTLNECQYNDSRLVSSMVIKIVFGPCILRSVLESITLTVSVTSTSPSCLTINGSQIRVSPGINVSLMSSNGVKSLPA